MNEATLAERTVIRDDGCHEYTGPRKGRGYGGWARPLGYAHRAAYTFHVGPIPAGHMVHHLCGFKLCVNPDHLVAVSPREHGLVHRQEMCARGLHEMTPDNTYEWRKGTASMTRCRACRRDRDRERTSWQGNPHNKDKTHCKHGHPFSGENLRILPGERRACRECGRLATAAYEQRRRDTRQQISES